MDTSPASERSGSIEISRARLAAAIAPKVESALRASGIQVPVTPGPGCFPAASDKVRTQFSLVFKTFAVELPELPRHVILTMEHMAVQSDFATAPSDTEPRIFLCPRDAIEAVEACAAGHAAAYFEELILPALKLGHGSSSGGAK
ncbi:MAG TPA: hypothetical protein VF744_15960 [Beijerinckiaceae bacterium]